MLTHEWGSTGSMVVTTAIAFLGILVASLYGVPRSAVPKWVNAAVVISAFVLFLFVLAAYITSVGIKRDPTKNPDKRVSADPISFGFSVSEPTVRVVPSEASIRAFRALSDEIRWERDRGRLLPALLKTFSHAHYERRLERSLALYSKLSDLGISAPTNPSMRCEFFIRLHPLSVAGDLMKARNLSRSAT